MASNIELAAGMGEDLTKEKIKELGLEKQLGDLTGKAAADKLKGMSSMKKGMMSLVAGAKSLFNPYQIVLWIVTQIVNAMKLLDGQAGDIAKNLGVSYESGLELSKASKKMSQDYGDMTLLSKDFVNAQLKLNEQFGTSAQFSQEMAGDYALIDKRLNLSADSMEFLASTQVKTGQGMMDQLATMNSITMEFNHQNNTLISNKELQEGIGKTSKALRLTYKGNVKELGNAVMQAKKLGLELSEVESISNHILDFESSIQSELEAELLLGKNLNLEKARYFALQGETGKVAEEILKNQAIMNAFETKNVIAQEAAAQALGMNRDELAGMVSEQQQLEAMSKMTGKNITSISEAQKEYNKLRAGGMSAEEAAAQLQDESLAKQLENQSVAERMEAVMASLQEIWLDIAEELLPAINEAMPSIISSFKVIKGLLTYVVNSLMRPFVMMWTLVSEIIKGVEEMFSGSLEGFAKGLLRIFLSPVQMLINGFIHMWNAAVKGFDSVIPGDQSGWKIKPFNLTDAIFADDMVQKPGYGKRTILSPEGSIQLNDNDTIVAGTNLKRNNSSASQDNSALIARIDKLIAINQQIAQKQTVLEMNGNKVGEGIAQTDRRIQ